MFFNRNQTPPKGELKVYADRCLTCNESERLAVIDFVAKKHGYKVNMRRVYVLPELRAEADVYNVPMPFIALNEHTLDFYAVGEKLLEERTLEDFINEYKNETTD